MKSVQIQSFFLSVFSCIWARKNSAFGNFLRSEYLWNHKHTEVDTKKIMLIGDDNNNDGDDDDGDDDDE